MSDQKAAQPNDLPEGTTEIKIVLDAEGNIQMGVRGAMQHKCMLLGLLDEAHARIQAHRPPPRDQKRRLADIPILDPKMLRNGE